MIRKLLTIFIVAPLGIIFVVFAVANRHLVTVSLDPFGADAPAISATLPLFVVILACILFGVLVGGTAAWMNQSKWRHRARRADADLRAMRIERDDLKAELTARDQATTLPAPRRAAY
ncbi:MAG: lipopolysaccharide assembly protein LapA domain-containing protein [Variibacter sp.]